MRKHADTITCASQWPSNGAHWSQRTHEHIRTCMQQNRVASPREAKSLVVQPPHTPPGQSHQLHPVTHTWRYSSIVPRPGCEWMPLMLHHKIWNLVVLRAAIAPIKGDMTTEKLQLHMPMLLLVSSPPNPDSSPFPSMSDFADIQ